MAAKKVTITIDEEILERLAPYRNRVNVSALASEAVVAELDRLETEDRAAAAQDIPQMIEAYIETAPLTVRAELEAAQGRIPMPTSIQREITKRGAGRPAYIEEALALYTPGTVSTWERYRVEAANSSLQIMEYKPGKHES